MAVPQNLEPLTLPSFFQARLCFVEGRVIGKGHPFLFQIALCQGDSEPTHTIPGILAYKIAPCPAGLGSGPTDMSRSRTWMKPPMAHCCCHQIIPEDPNITIVSMPWLTLFPWEPINWAHYKITMVAKPYCGTIFNQ